MEIVFSILSLKSTFVRRLLNGQAVVIIKNGVIDQKAMKRVRLTVMDLIEQLRVQNVFDISTVAFAVLEINGELSVLLKSGDQPATAKDVGAKNDKAVLPLPVISDGKIISENLTALKITHSDVEKILKQNNLTVKQVFLLTLDRKKNLTLIKMG